MNRCPSRRILALLAVTCTLALHAQDRKTLEQKREQIDEQIRLAGKLIERAESDQKSSEQELQILNRQISLREQRISNMRSEVAEIDRKVNETQDVIDALSDDLVQLKGSYAKMLQYAYKNRSSYDRLSYIFAAESFGQAFRRSRYLNQLAEHRQRQAVLIKETTVTLESKKLELTTQREEKLALLGEQHQERERLGKDKEEQRTVLSKLQQKEQELRSDLKKKQTKRKELDQAIRRIIEEEIRKSKEANKGTFALTPEAKELSGEFERNLGKLPWPVERGVITSRFGRQPHPVLKGIEVENNGVDIATEKNATVRAVFRGKISSVIVIPGAGKAVVIDHGAYRTVYSNLRDSHVQKGDRIDVNQSVGVVMTDDERSTAHFEIWKISASGVAKEDPARWLLDL